MTKDTQDKLPLPSVDQLDEFHLDCEKFFSQVVKKQVSDENRLRLRRFLDKAHAYLNKDNLIRDERLECCLSLSLFALSSVFVTVGQLHKEEKSRYREVGKSAFSEDFPGLMMIYQESSDALNGHVKIWRELAPPLHHWQKIFREFPKVAGTVEQSFVNARRLDRRKSDIKRRSNKLSAILWLSSLSGLAAFVYLANSLNSCVNGA